MPQAQSNTAPLALTAADFADFIDESDLLTSMIRAIRGRLFFPKFVSISPESFRGSWLRLRQSSSYRCYRCNPR